MLKFLLTFLFSVTIVVSIETSREMEGYPNGYLSECPGVTKDAVISNRSLHHLAFIHLQKGNFLYAKRHKYNYFQMRRLAKNMDFNNKTILFMNGYMDSTHMTPVSAAMGGMYTRKGYNVLLLEYVEFTAVMYPVAARLLRAVGKRTAEMLAELTKLGLDPKKLDILGISHGGQGISFIGKNYRRITGRNVSRITALDPSGPCFRRLGPEDRIDASDADLVDILHTNNEGYGFAGAVGQVNFYANGAAMEYPDQFMALKCDSIQDARDRNCFDRPLVTNLMGPKTDFNKPGIYYLETNNYYPYYLGNKGVEKNNNLISNYLKNLNKDDVLVI